MSEWYAYREGGVELRFHTCTVAKWDGHAAYINGIQRLQGTKAVDFAVLAPDDLVALVELKDFRGHGTENRRRLRGGELAREVAEKARDTLAGMTWACGRDHCTDDIGKITSGFYRRDRDKILVILWLDQDDLAKPAEASALASTIRSCLQPHIQAKVVVTSLRLFQGRLPASISSWLEVRSLPR